MSFTKKYYLGLAIIAIVGFIGYQIFQSSHRPSDVNEKLYNDAVAVVNILDNYLEGTYDISEASSRLSRIDYENHVDEENPSENLVSLKIWRVLLSFDSDSDSEIKQHRDELAKEINYKK